MNGGGTTAIIINIIMDSTRTQARPPLAQHAHMQGGQRAPTPAAPTVKGRPLDDDIVPSLPPDWQPPAFLTEEVPTSESEASEEEEASGALIM